MAPNPPQTLSVKRKRNEAPVDALAVDAKRAKSETRETYVWRRVPKQNDAVPSSGASTPTGPTPRFQYSHTAKHPVLQEAKPATEDEDAVATQTEELESPQEVKIALSEPNAQNGTSRPRKRPGAGAALHPTKTVETGIKAKGTGPSEEELRRFEQLEKDVENAELSGPKPSPSPAKYKPKVPALRYKDRHPEQAAAFAKHDADAMDIDEYVYDTYVREIVMPDADGKIPEPQGTVGIIVLNEEDEEWWNGDDESDKEFDTDDEDENAEDYYANDYPEDELSSDDEFDRNLYQKKFRHGSDDEEYNLEDDDDDDDRHAGSGDEDDEHFRRVMGTARQLPGY